MIDRIDQQMGTLRTASNLRAYRQELLASNIANADTPYYKARDIDFKAALAGALSGRGDAGTLNRTSPRHLAGAASSSAPYGTEYQAAVDGNTVNMDIERSAFAENSVQLEAALTFIRQQFSQLQTAIQGQ
jgi:flagellar basal-body rod protein FlgB